MISAYDPFARGPHRVVERSWEARDAARDRTFPISAWRPDDGNAHPLVLFSHASGNHRRGATFLTGHLASHGYVVAALDHSEVVAPEFRAQPGETAEQKSARWRALIDARVPDARFLLGEVRGDDPRVGIVGHSFGGWTALATVDAEPRIAAVVALSPAGASKRRPGILPTTLEFRWDRDVPTLILAAEGDTSLPLEGMLEIFGRTPATKRMFVLRRADHMHFMDNAAAIHEDFRTMAATGDIADLQKRMVPFSELVPAEAGYDFTRALSLAHLDATLKGNDAARAFLAQDAARELARRGIDAYEFTRGD